MEWYLCDYEDFINRLLLQAIETGYIMETC